MAPRSLWKFTPDGRRGRPPGRTRQAMLLVALKRFISTETRSRAVICKEVAEQFGLKPATVKRELRKMRRRAEI